MHYLYLLGKLPPKIHYEYKTKEYYQEIDKFHKLCEEINMIGDNKLKSIEDTQQLRVKYIEEVTPLKSEREKLRGMCNKTTNETDKSILETKINTITEDINKINSKIQTCKRIIDNFERGEIENKLIQKRTENNRLKNDKENIKCKVKMRNCHNL